MISQYFTRRIPIFWPPHRNEKVIEYPTPMQSTMHLYEVRPRKDKRGVTLISDALPFGRLWYAEPNASDFVIKKLPPHTPTV
jgi:hypothetical protein